MSDNQFPNQHVKNVLDGNNLSISAPCPSAKGKYSSLNFRITKGNPRLIIYTNDPEDQGNDHGRIVVKLNPLSFGAILAAWENTLNAEPGHREPIIEIEDFSWGRGGQRSEKPEVTHKIAVGKDGDGVISLMVMDAKNRERPRIKFEIKAPRFVRLVSSDGNPLDKAAESVRFSNIWLKLLGELTPNLYASTWEEPKKKNGGGGNGGGYNRGGNGGGGYNRGGGNGGGGEGRRQGGESYGNDMDDDIPF